MKDTVHAIGFTCSPVGQQQTPVSRSLVLQRRVCVHSFQDNISLWETYYVREDGWGVGQGHKLKVAPLAGRIHCEFQRDLGFGNDWLWVKLGPSQGLKSPQLGTALDERWEEATLAGSCGEGWEVE